MTARPEVPLTLPRDNCDAGGVLNPISGTSCRAVMQSLRHEAQNIHNEYTVQTESLQSFQTTMRTIPETTADNPGGNRATCRDSSGRNSRALVGAQQPPHCLTKHHASLLLKQQRALCNGKRNEYTAQHYLIKYVHRSGYCLLHTARCLAKLGWNKTSG